jgi:hypothetical protein
MGKLGTKTPSAGAVGTVLVSNNDFTLPATLYLGNYALISNEHFLVGGNTAATATNLAAAIDSLLEFSATVLGSTVTVSGPFGPDGNTVRLEASYAGAVQNYTLTPNDGSLELGAPVIGPPEIIG